MICELGKHIWTTTELIPKPLERCFCGKYTWSQWEYIKKATYELEAENAALRQRVEELEAFIAKHVDSGEYWYDGEGVA